MNWTKPYYGITHLEGMRAGFYGTVVHEHTVWRGIVFKSPDYRTNWLGNSEDAAKSWVETLTTQLGAFPNV